MFSQSIQSASSFLLDEIDGRTDVADDAESRGEFVLLVFWEYGTHYVIWRFTMSNFRFKTKTAISCTYIR